MTKPLKPVFKDFNPNIFENADARISRVNREIAEEIREGVKAGNAAFKEAGLEQVFRVLNNYSYGSSKPINDVFIRVSTNEEECSPGIDFNSKGLAVEFEHGEVIVSGLDVSFTHSRPDAPVYSALHNDRGVKRSDPDLNQKVVTLAVMYLQHWLSPEHREVFDKLLGIEPAETEPSVTGDELSQ